MVLDSSLSNSLRTYLLNKTILHSIKLFRFEEAYHACIAIEDDKESLSLILPLSVGNNISKNLTLESWIGSKN